MTRRLRSVVLSLLVAGAVVGGGFWAFHTQSRHYYGPQQAGVPTSVLPVYVQVTR